MTTPPGPTPEPPPGPLVPRPVDDRREAGDEPPLLDTERIPATGARATPGFAAVPVAWAVAIVTDVVQWMVFPFFLSPMGWPVDGVLDVVVAGVLIKLLGWHWAFLPGFVMELIPGVDMVPTWTVAVFLATRGRRKR